jgi:predicted AAA+ superfamily ATPase
MQGAFGWGVDEYVYYGGYPGAAPLIGDPDRWRRYVLDSLIETTISRDIMLMQRVDKPALLRRLFEVGCRYSGQVLSYTKILGQLQEAGNTTTLARYLDLLKGCGLLEGLQKYAGQQVRRRSSSPKFQVHNNALLTSQQDLSLEQARQDSEYWGRLVESAVGAHLVNSARRSTIGVHYWAHASRQVDFVLTKGSKTVAIEVKGSGRRTALAGLDAFASQFKVHKKLLVGGQGIRLDEFLATEADAWF